jgi:hypothetical protein
MLVQLFSLFYSSSKGKDTCNYIMEVDDDHTLLIILLMYWIRCLKEIGKLQIVASKVSRLKSLWLLSWGKLKKLCIQIILTNLMNVSPSNMWNSCISYSQWTQISLKQETCSLFNPFHMYYFLTIILK